MRFPIADIDFDVVWQATHGYQESVAHFQWTAGQPWKPDVQYKELAEVAIEA